MPEITDAQELSSEAEAVRVGDWLTASQYSQLSGYSVPSVYYRGRKQKIETREASVMGRTVMMFRWEGERSLRKPARGRDIERSQPVRGRRHRVVANLSYESALWLEEKSQALGVDRSKLVEQLVVAARNEGGVLAE